MVSDRDDLQGPAGLPVHAVGWGAAELDFEPGAEFWSRVERIAGGGDLVDALDACMSGHSAPRVWLVLHEPVGIVALEIGLAQAFDVGRIKQCRRGMKVAVPDLAA